jgi:glutamate-1-semialdehyde 2,1-aminomutase
MLRFVTSGTEAVMSALRLARAHTRRDLVVKFDGCYHGHSDGLLAAAGSGVATLGIPGSPGVPPSVAATTISLPFNDLSAVERTLQRHSGHIAAVIVEPIPCNMGVVPARPGYLEGLRRLTRQHDVLLIFDEVISGFRAGWGGAQGLCGVEPDLTCLGKVIGGGLPVGAYGGRRDLMELIAPSGPVYQAGTLAGSPPAMAAGVVTLRRLRDTDVFARLRASAAALTSALSQVVAGSPPPARVAQQASLMTLFFSSEPVTDYSSARAADTTRYAAFFHRMLEAGVSLPPSQFEAWFLTAAHGEAEIAHVVEAAEAALSTGALPARAG